MGDAAGLLDFGQRGPGLRVADVLGDRAVVGTVDPVAQRVVK
jgi:hypothetical protein